MPRCHRGHGANGFFQQAFHSDLVGGFKHLDYFPFPIWDVILPIDELIFFKMVIAPPTRESWWIFVQLSHVHPCSIIVFMKFHEHVYFQENHRMILVLQAKCGSDHRTSGVEPEKNIEISFGPNLKFNVQNAGFNMI